MTEDLNIPVLEHQQVATGIRPPAILLLQERKATQKKIAFFGHFDSSNFGNESTLQAILYHLRCFHPDAEVTCISTGVPEATVVTHQLKTIPISQTLVKWRPGNLFVRVVRKV
jgi:hypothetical protein